MALPNGYMAQLALAGQCFIGTGPVAGIAIPVSTTTTCRFCLWNPQGSGVNLLLNTLTIAKVDAGDAGVGGYALSYVPNTGSTVATAAPVATFTALTPLNALISVGPSAKARFASAATGTTVTTAGTTFYALGISKETITDTVGEVICQYDFSGSVIVPQGVFIHLIGTAADTQVTMPTITWAEIPA